MSKRLPWLRLYTRMVDDDKLKLLAFEDRWHFVALLCLKGEGLLDKADTTSLLMRKVAVKLGLDVRTLEEVARRLAEVGLIDQDTLQPVKWAVLQMQSDVDTTAAERKQRQRERQKAAKAAPSNEVTPGHEDGTDMSRVTGTNVTRTDTDTDTEEERETREDSRSSSPASKSITLKAYLVDCKAKAVKPIPEGHHIRQDMTDAGISDEMAQIAWLRFREEHTTGLRKDKKYKDWPAVFANSVKDRWYRLWTVHADGPAQWTSEGLQAKRVADAASAGGAA